MAGSQQPHQMPTAGAGILPLILDRRASSGSLAAGAMFIAAAASVLLAPFMLLLVHIAFDPRTVMSAVDDPLKGLQLALGLAIALAFVAIPFGWLVKRAFQPDRFVVAGDLVRATRTTSSGEQSAWDEPLSAYQGIAHHIRTSLSGAEHEIVLVHREHAKSVVLCNAPRIAQPQLDAMATLLKLPQVPASAMYFNDKSKLKLAARLPELKAA